MLLAYVIQKRMLFIIVMIVIVFHLFFQESMPLNVLPRETQTHELQFGESHNRPPGLVSNIMFMRILMPSALWMFCFWSNPRQRGRFPLGTNHPISLWKCININNIIKRPEDSQLTIYQLNQVAVIIRLAPQIQPFETISKAGTLAKCLQTIILGLTF